MSKAAVLLERFHRGPEAIEAALAGMRAEEADHVPGPDKWTIRQIMAHVSDSELVGADRFRRVIAEENPTLVGYDQNAWARNLDYYRREVSQAVATFRRVRMETYDLLRALPESAFARTGKHTERGPVSLLDLLEIYADHAESHARQMQGAREHFRQSKS